MANPPFPNYQNDPAGAIPVYIVGPGGVGGEPLGFQAIADLSAAVGLTPPVGATYAIINPTGQAVRWRDVGVNPTAAIGMPIPANGSFTYYGDLSAIKFIQQTASAALNVSYYK